MKTRLNVLLITYNHENFIEESLYSVIRQKTDFEFDIIVADDQSTDGTLDTVNRIARETNIQFRFLEAGNNLGITKNYQRGFKSCDAEYVAVMEGDDIWTNPDRLQKHLDFLDHHYECNMTFNRYLVANYEKAQFNLQPCWEPPNGYQLIGVRDIVKDNLIGNFSTCVYRRTALNAIPADMFELKAYDWLTNIMVATNGMVGYIASTMNVYRLHTKGVWSSNKQEDNDRELLKQIEIYDSFTNRLFHDEFEIHGNKIKGKLILAKPIQIVKSPGFSRGRRYAAKIKDFMPPLLVWIFKMLIPPKIWEKLAGR